MSLNVQIENASAVARKLKVKVPADVVGKMLERKLQETQRRVKLKGFREGHVPMTLVKQYFGNDIRHNVYHAVIEESLNEAIRTNKLRAVGQPVIEGDDDHTAHEIQEGQGLEFTATVEVLPEVEVKEYKGLSLKKDKVEVKDADIESVVTNIRNAHGKLVPLENVRGAQKGDFVNFSFSGKVDGKQELEQLKGTRTQELGNGELLPEFEKALEGMKAGETKNFDLAYPADYPDRELSSKTATFTLNCTEVKERKLPELNDEFAKEAGYESVADMKTKATEMLKKNKSEEADRKLRNDLLQALIDKNPFEVPQALIRAQSRELATEYARSLEREGFTQAMVQEAVTSQADSIKTRAELQVKAGLILESISKKEGLEVKKEDLDAEFKKLAEGMNQPEKTIREFFENNVQRLENMRFRLMEDKTIQAVLSSAKVKEA